MATELEIISLFQISCAAEIGGSARKVSGLSRRMVEECKDLTLRSQRSPVNFCDRVFCINLLHGEYFTPLRSSILYMYSIIICAGVIKKLLLKLCNKSTKAIK